MKKILIALKDFIFTIIKLILLAIFLLLLGSVGVIGYSELKAIDAKDYLIMEHDYTDWNVFAIKVTEYVYEEDTNCSSLMFKKCTKDKNLDKKFIFLTTKKDKFVVIQHSDGTFTIEDKEVQEN